MVTPLFSFWNPARQASMADSWALDPAPSSLPERSLVPPLVLEVSFPAPHADRAKPRASAATLGAAMRRREVRFTSSPTGHRSLDTVNLGTRSVRARRRE